MYICKNVVLQNVVFFLTHEDKKKCSRMLRLLCVIYICLS